MSEADVKNDSDRYLDGQLFAKMAQGGAAQLRSNAEEVNKLNVFPVPDGDTGFNMLKTVEGGIVKIKDYQYVSHIYINNLPLSQEDIQKVLKDETGYTFNDVKTNKSIRIVVREKSFIINSSSEGSGFISPQGKVIVQYNHTQTFNFIPNLGYKVDTIFVDDKELKGAELSNAINNGYSFSNAPNDLPSTITSFIKYPSSALKVNNCLDSSFTITLLFGVILPPSPLDA